MPFFPADFFADTQHISGQAAAVYLVLLGHAWLRGANLPNDQKTLARLARVSWQRWTSMKDEIMPFWDLGPDGLLRQKRQFQDHQNVKRKTKISSDSANRRWGKNQLDINESSNANASKLHMPNASKGNANYNYKEERFLFNESRPEKGNGELMNTQIEERWMNEQELRRQASGQKVYVKQHTPAGEAWAAWSQRNLRAGQVWDRNGGWWFPSEWPPNEKPKET
jgi:uncharacterized protein YdaU (DUF1376 family)